MRLSENRVQVENVVFVWRARLVCPNTNVTKRPAMKIELCSRDTNILKIKESVTYKCDYEAVDLSLNLLKKTYCHKNKELCQ